MKGNPILSIIIPVYNVEAYIRKCIESILNQTYKNIEIIAIDDGSTDNSLKILKQYELNNNNITVISQENSGQSVARNKGIMQSRGKYIHFLDSDDYITTESYKNMLHLMEKHNLDLIRFGAEPFIDDVEIKIYKRQYDFSRYFEKGRVYNKENFLLANLKAFSVSPCLYLVKRELVINNNINFKPGLMHEDELFTLEVILNTNLAMYDSNLYYKRRYRKNSIMTTHKNVNAKKSFESYFIIITEMSRMMERYLEPDEKKLIKKELVHCSAF
ncbi:glycosyltransferase [Robertmurraya massiliosenegalensis]|uniref:glycosyltransferase n=1 Tax=Robertmurraya massiliosenegalensis TaxID=1287657 RepID=UPI0002E4FF86|nr:glycosyltransferase [Robertmurraya massiliosenegalensis]